MCIYFCNFIACVVSCRASTVNAQSSSITGIPRSPCLPRLKPGQSLICSPSLQLCHFKNALQEVCEKRALVICHLCACVWLQSQSRDRTVCPFGFLVPFSSSGTSHPPFAADLLRLDTLLTPVCSPQPPLPPQGQSPNVIVWEFCKSPRSSSATGGHDISYHCLPTPTITLASQANPGPLATLSLGT